MSFAEAGEIHYSREFVFTQDITSPTTIISYWSDLGGFLCSTDDTVGSMQGHGWTPVGESLIITLPWQVCPEYGAGGPPSPAPNPHIPPVILHISAYQARSDARQGVGIGCSRQSYKAIQ